MSIQISGSLACMTLYFSVLLFTIYCYNVLLLSVFISIAKQYVHYALCVYVWCCNSWDCSLSWWPVLTSGFFSPQRLFEKLISTYYCNCLWCCRVTYVPLSQNWQVETHLTEIEFWRNFLCIRTTQCRGQNSNRVQTTKASQTRMWKWSKKKVLLLTERKGKMVFHESESLCLFYTVNNWVKKIYILGILFHLIN